MTTRPIKWAGWLVAAVLTTARPGICSPLLLSSSAGIAASQNGQVQPIGTPAADGTDTTNVGPLPSYEGGRVTTLPIPAGSRLTVADAISIAIKYHPRAAAAAAESNASQERVGEARSQLGPQLYSLSEYLRSSNNGIGNTSYYNPNRVLPRLTGTNHDLPAGDTSQDWDSSNSYAGGVALSQYLLDFGRRRGFVDQRRFEAAAAREQEAVVDLQLIYEVSHRYYRVLQAKRLVDVYEKAVEERKLHLHEAQVKAKAGLRPELDVYLTEAEVQRAQLHLVDARNSEADAIVAFDNALGLGGERPNYRLADVLAYSQISETVGRLLQDAFQFRPDMKALTDEVSAMGAQIAQYRSDYFPTANAVAGYSALGTGLPAANNFNAGIVITWPIFNSFLTRHEVAEAKFHRTELEERVEELRQQVILQVETAFLDWQASLQRIERAKRTREASRAELELAERRYGAGLGDIVELEDAQRSYTEDDAAYANALYGSAIAKAAVDDTTGRALSELH